MEENKSQQEIVENYDLLKRIGILDRMDGLSQRIRDLQELMREAESLFNEQTIAGLIKFISDKFLNKFMPSSLCFVIQEDSSRDIASLYCYKNMKPVDPPIEIRSIEPYKYFFSLSPTTVNFSVFEYMIGKRELTDVFSPLNPQIIVPVIGLSGVNGFIIVGAKLLGEGYAENEIEFINVLMRFASLSLQNILHYTRAITDFKTHLYNHSFFMIRVEEELARAKRYGKRLSLLMIDVDHFKKFNDSYGHLAGDKVLYDLSRILASMVRQEDVPARFGGEEFVILLTETAADKAFLAADRIRQAVQDHIVDFEGKKMHVTISIGVGTFGPDHVLDSTALFEEADAAVYHSKQTGRNRVSLFHPDFNSKLFVV